MKIEDQVCKLERGKLLKQLGILQESIWHHCFYVNPEMIGTNYGLYHYSMVKEILEDNEGDNFDVNFVSCFTVAELGVMIDGAFISALNTLGKWEAWPNPNNSNLSEDDYNLPIHGKYETEAECLAGNLIDFINNGVLSVDKCNERLKSS